MGINNSSIVKTPSAPESGRRVEKIFKAIFDFLYLMLTSDQMCAYSKHNQVDETAHKTAGHKCGLNRKCAEVA